MMRSMCGGFLLATLAGVLACSGDPTGDLVGTGAAIQADPSSLFMGQGETKGVIVSVLDAQGNELEITGFGATPGSAAVAVTEDSTFLGTNAGAPLPTSKRLNVTGQSAAATSITVTANGVSKDIPIKVTPISTTVTLSTPTPAATEGVVITLPAGYKFGAGGGASVETTPGITTAIAPDSSSATVFFLPGTTGTITVDSVAVDFAPGVLFSLPTDQTVTVGPVTPLAGTDDPSTAPALTLPPLGGTTVTFDAPDFAATIDHFYRLNVTEAGDYTVTVNWTVGSDIDAPICVADPTCAAEDFTDPTVSSSQPETGTFTLPVGTSTLLVEDFGENANGATVSITISH
jgi:hypothetical protein